MTAFVLACFICRSEGIEIRSEPVQFPSNDHTGYDIGPSSSASKLKAIARLLFVLKQPTAGWQGASLAMNPKTIFAPGVVSSTSYVSSPVTGSRCSTPTCSSKRRALNGMKEKPAKVGDVYEGYIDKLTEYGIVVSIGSEKQTGLVHITSLTDTWVPQGKVIAWIEENVGTIGDVVTVKVRSTEYQGKKNRRDLELLDVAGAITRAVDEDDVDDGWENDDEFAEFGELDSDVSDMDDDDWDTDEIEWKQNDGKSDKVKEELDEDEEREIVVVG